MLLGAALVFHILIIATNDLTNVRAQLPIPLYYHERALALTLGWSGRHFSASLSDVDPNHETGLMWTPVAYPIISLYATFSPTMGSLSTSDQIAINKFYNHRFPVS